MSTETPTPNDIQRASYQFEMDAIDRNVVPMLDQIIAHQPRNTITENQFKQFVPMFKGEETNKNAQVEWVSLAGSAVDEVNVTDQSGNLLFVVPPLCDTSTIDGMNRDGRIMVHAMMQNYENNARNLPSIAGNQLTANLLSSVDHTVSEETPEHKERRERWVKIMSRYDGEVKPVADGPLVVSVELSDNNDLEV